MTRSALLRCALAALLLSAAPAGAQDDRQPALFDPSGSVLLPTADQGDVELRFPPLRWPGPGTHAFGGDATLQFGRRVDGRFESFGTGRIEVERLDAERLRCVATIDQHAAAGRRFDFDRAVELRRHAPAVVRGGPKPARIEEPPSAELEDLVFCAIGSAGTGLPGQAQVAASIARRAGPEGLDAVLTLGGLLAPDGITAADRSALATRFDRVYPLTALPMPFYVALGPAEHRGEIDELLRYAAISPRLRLPASTYGVEYEIGDRSLALVCVDTHALLGDLADVRTRIARSRPGQFLEGSKATWRIAFGHLPMYTRIDGVDQAAVERYRGAMETWFERMQVDVYVSGAGRALELLDERHGVLHVAAGGGGGPEVAASVEWAEDTRFAATGGGSVWFRVRPERLEIVFRDADGAALYVHRIER